MGCCIKFTLGSILIVLLYVLYIMYRGAPMPDMDPNPWWKEGPRGQDSKEISKFTIKIKEKDLEDLHQRLALPLRLTPPLHNANFTYGINTNTLNGIIKYWKEKYNWRQREQRLNSFSHYKTQIEGLMIHFMRVKPQVKDPNVVVRPLLMLHGWPGSIVEFYDILPLLTSQHKDSNVVFEVICPSIPGYGFSDASEKQGLGSLETAQIFYKLMKRLNFDKFYVQGGDWGSLIATNMATLYQEDVLGIHVNMMAVMHPWVSVKYLLGSILPSGFVMDAVTEKATYPLCKLFHVLLRESGYFHLQTTKPDTIGVALGESPAGLAAYILEKFSGWTHKENINKPDGGLLSKDFPISLDSMLDNINVYWFTHSITTSIRFYAEFIKFSKLRFDEIPSYVPFGGSAFGQELLNAPESFVRVKFPDIVEYRQHNEGGHFAAMELPQVLADDVFSFVNKVENRRNKPKTEL